jgi:hypothetical protein
MLIKQKMKRAPTMKERAAVQNPKRSHTTAVAGGAATHPNNGQKRTSFINFLKGL